MAGRVLKYTDGAGEEMGKSLAFSDRHRGTCQQPDLGIEGLAHERNTDVFRREFGCITNTDFDLLECAEDGGVVIATEEEGTHILDQDRIKILARKQISQLVGLEVGGLEGLQELMTAAGDEDPVAGVPWFGSKEAFSLKPDPGFHEGTSHLVAQFAARVGNNMLT